MDAQLRHHCHTPNELCAQLHNRTPVVLKPDAWPVWLGEQPVKASAFKALLRPIPSDEMTCWPASARVGNVKNNDPSLIEPIAAQGCHVYLNRQAELRLACGLFRPK